MPLGINGLSTELFSSGTSDFRARLLFDETEVAIEMDYKKLKDWVDRLSALAERLREINNLDERGCKRKFITPEPCSECGREYPNHYSNCSQDIPF